MTGANRLSKLRWPYALGLLAVVVFVAGYGMAQGLRPNEREAKPQINVQDKDDIRKADSKIWVLELKFYDPRPITVDIPGRGRKLCWYMKYQVLNNTPDPHFFIPDFELVTHDKPGLYRDQVLPKVEEAIKQIEDPTGYLDIKNSVTIASKPIPVSKPGLPRPVTGVAIWDDVNPESNRYSIFVSGLSNGWSLAEDPANPTMQVIRRKTLQLNFRRVGDRYYQTPEEIKFVPPAEWIYRSTNARIPGINVAEKAPPQAPKK
jgi:hypothetical protein